MGLLRRSQSRGESGRVGPEILLAVGILACGICVGALYYQTQQDVQALHANIDSVQARSDSNIKQLETQLGQRYLQLLKLAEDLAMQQGRMVTLERNLTLQKDSVTQLQDTFHTEVDALKKAGGERSKEVSLLEDRFKTAISLKEKSITQLQEEYDVLKNLMDDQSALLVMMREQAIVNAAGSAGASGSSSGAIPPGGPDTVTPAANPAMQNQSPNSSPLAAGIPSAGIPPAGSQGPQSFQAGSIVPIPSSEAPQPTTQPPPPMQIHDADTAAAAATAVPATPAPATPTAPAAIPTAPAVAIPVASPATPTPPHP